ncbi:MAG: hypothetical protein IJW57_06280 [Spirochaetaceae bacterium]|nr:hypothetical protein [Spirochaetaceae bacterium]
MALSYDQLYLSDVQKNLGFLFQFCLRTLGKSPEELQQDFLSSIIPTQIEFGNPDFLSGKSGLELAFFLYQDIEGKVEEALQEPYYPPGRVLGWFCGGLCPVEAAAALPGAFGKLSFGKNIVELSSDARGRHQQDG